MYSASLVTILEARGLQERHGPGYGYVSGPQSDGLTNRLIEGRTGKHDVTDYDWEQYLRFADELVR